MKIIYLFNFAIFCHMSFGESEFGDCLYENNIWTANNVIMRGLIKHLLIQDQCRKWCPQLNTCYEPCVQEVSRDMVKTRRRQFGKLEPNKQRQIQLNAGCNYENTLWTARLIYDHCRKWCPQKNTCYEPCVKGLSDNLIHNARKRSAVLESIKREANKSCKPKQ